MKRILAFILTFVCALTGAKHQGGLTENVRAAFYEEAERAYRDIIAYDGDAPVTKKEIVLLYARNALFAPVRAWADAFSGAIDALWPLTPKEYAERCIYEGRILETPPKGVIFVRAYLYPFSPQEAKAYDGIQKSGDTHALDALYSPLEKWALHCRGAYTAENGFDMYIRMQGGSALIPVAEGVLYLDREAACAALSLSRENPVSPPVRDARGVVVFEFVSG